MSGTTRLSWPARRIEWKKNVETQKQNRADLRPCPIAAARKRHWQDPAPTCARKRSGSRSGALRNRHAPLMRGSRLKDVADAAGCSESLVSKIENNKIEPSLQVLHKLCTVLKIG